MKHVTLILFFIALGNMISAQNIKGHIRDEHNNSVSGVMIISKKSGAHWHSNDFGDFYISEIKLPDTLVISRIGFEKKVISVKNEEELSIVLNTKNIEIGEVSVNADMKSLHVITEIDLETKPVNSSQEVLRTVPGLIIGQHAGGGKAEQIFLRGFDIDHGTDINITVDGLPVNMVSHAHGQGYADLHFLIPEIIEEIDFGKGTYYTDKGNFTTSGYVEFKTKEKLNTSSLSLDYGQFNTMRMLTLLNLTNTEKNGAYIAGEYLMTDGAFDASQNFNRINVFGKYNTKINTFDKLTFTASYFKSKWDASGQIPQRAVDAGLISRFGAIDATEGGYTDRINLSLDHFKYLKKNTFINNKLFWSKYDFQLFSDFTFFLNDSINGDQIKQEESRNIYGAESELTHILNLKKAEIKFKAGLGVQYHDIDDIGLAHTVHRKVLLEQVMLGDIDETNMFAYLNTDLDLGKLLINIGLRTDYFMFEYIDKLKEEYEREQADKPAFCPKFNIIWTPKDKIQFYVKSGVGYHSNDTRVSVVRNGNDILPLAYGADLGTVLKPAKRLFVNAALWYLFLEQEFVYVGDEGVVEPGGRTQRYGADLGIRLQLTDNLFLDNDVNYTIAESIDDPEGENYIPLAPDLTNTGGISLTDFHGFSGGIRYRYIKDRPANEDFSVTAEGYFVTDMNISYSIGKIELSCIIENLFNTEWKETQFATETRLYNEPTSVEEIHFIPGTPFFLKGRLTYRF